MKQHKSKQQNLVNAIEVDEIEYTVTQQASSSKQNFLKRLFENYKRNKKITIPLTIFILLLVLMCVPFTRYKILGLFIKKTTTFTIIDSQNSRPVSDANISLNGVQKNTDANGFVEFDSVPVGPQSVVVEKKYYDKYSESVIVGLRGENTHSINITANGRLVPLVVKNKINGKLLSGANIKVKDSSAITDEGGLAVIALDSKIDAVDAVIELAGYNSSNVTIKVSDDNLPENDFKLVPEGRVSFLSKSSGRLDVVSTNLDGTDRKIVLEGTGQEDENSTTLFASRDWKYLVLHAKREGSLPSLYLIDTSNNSTTKIDESGDVLFPVGWSEKYFVYLTASSQLKYWQPKYNLLKSYDTSEKVTRTLDYSNAEGNSEIDYASERISDVNILSNELVYSKIWTSDYYSGGRIIGKNHSFNSIKPGGTDKQLIKEFEAEIDGNSFVTSKKYNPEIVYTKQTNYTQNLYYEYLDGKITERPQLSQSFDNVFQVYFSSPSGTKTLWSESRDGKNVVFIGDKSAGNSRKVIDKSEYRTVGWYTDDYLILTSKGSELFIASASDSEEYQSVKISDFQPNNGQVLDSSMSYIIR